MIREDAGHHGFTHGNGANADARIVAPLGHDFRVAAAFVDGPPRRQDGTGRLHGKPSDDVLAGRWDIDDRTD